MKKFAVAVVLIILIVVGAVGGYRHYKTTPTYALSQLRASIQNHDPVLFKKYVDLETVLDKGAENMLEAKGEDNWAQQVLRGMALSLKPSLVAELKQRIETWIETGVVPEGGSGPVGKAANAVIGQLAQLMFLDVDDVKRAKKNAIVTVRVRHQVYGCDLVPVLFMREGDDGQLRLVEVTNIGDLLTQLRVGEMAWQESQNAAARKKIASVLRISGVTKSSHDELLGIRRKITISANARNGSDKAVTRVEAILTATTLVAPQITKKWPVTFDQVIPPDQTQALTWEMTANPFNAEEMAIYKAKADGLSLTFEVEALTLEGGQRLEIPFR